MLTALGAFFALAAAVAGCGSDVPSNSVAAVAGNPITTQAYKHWMFVAAKGNTQGATTAPVIVPTDPPDFNDCLNQVREQIPTLDKTPDKTLKSDCAELFNTLNGQVLDFLIKSYWYQAQAHALGIKETNKQVLSALATAQKQEFPTPAAFAAFLTSTGQTLADVKYRVLVNQLYAALLKRYTQQVTPAKIAAYYTSHASSFGTHETRNIRIIRNTSEKQVLAAKAALQSGQSWTVVAKKYSIDSATKDTGGLLVDVANGEVEHALNAAAFAAPVNKLEGPIHGTFGWYVFEVTKSTPATTEPLAKATPSIRQLLAGQYQTASENELNAAVKKSFGDKTFCREDYSMADCNGYKAPATTTTTPAVSPTATATTSVPSSSTSTTSSSSKSST